jgi:geranylgeranyl pyrophosphate synthase
VFRTLAIAPKPQLSETATSMDALREDRATSRLKIVPAERADRQRIREKAFAAAASMDRSRPIGRLGLETGSRQILADLGLSEGYLGWTMVILASVFWRDQVRAVPYARRLLLLPHCMRDIEQCPAKYNAIGLLCQRCGACELAGLKAQAEAKGWQVLIAEGSPAVVDMILHGKADAICGVACLDSLEKAFDKVLLAGIPCMAVPLLGNSCSDSTTDLDWVREMIDMPHGPGVAPTRTYVHLLRRVTRMFEPVELARLTSTRSAAFPISPWTATETIAHDFLSKGGKHSRPFITLAAYDAVTGGAASGADGPAHANALSDAALRIALAIEVFHKASLVHDDIEDDDGFRYGYPTVHREYGLPMAINVGDYLIGLGYGLVARQSGQIASDVVADILGRLADAHTKLCEGQGAELAWRDAADKRITPRDTLRIYALKTAPAFEAALFAGLRLAGPVDSLLEPASRFTRHLGVAFQILNDLEDWTHDSGNKMATGADVLGGRPTVLWAWALERLGEEDRRRLIDLVSHAPCDSAETIAQVRAYYECAGVFSLARDLVDRHRHRALEIAETIQPRPLAELLCYLADTVLA